MKRFISFILVFFIVFFCFIGIKYILNHEYDFSEDIGRDLIFAFFSSFGIEFIMPKVIRALNKKQK